MIKVEVGYVVISHDLAPQKYTKESEKLNVSEYCDADTLLVKSLNTQTFSIALQEYVITYLECHGVMIENSAALRSSCDFTPSVSISLQTVQRTICTNHNLESCTCDDGNIVANDKNKTSTVIAFCVIPHVLDDAGEFSESDALEQVEHTVQFSDDGSHVPISLLASVPLPTSVYIEEYGVYAKVIKIMKTIVNNKKNDEVESEEGTDISHRGNNVVTKAILNIPLLMIGAGGIGCELLKVLILYGFRHIHIIDLDTIDATNLNRQFLFTHEDIGESKAKMARRAVLKWFTCTSENKEHELEYECDERVKEPPNIVAHHAQVQAPEFNEVFFAQFGCVLSALDNVKARQHVNRMCAKVHIPLIESGTMGYNGQVQPILYGRYECYDCRPKPPDTQTFAVCTIHARPTTMVHCVHFAKELYNTLFANVNEKTEEGNRFNEKEEEQQQQKDDRNEENTEHELRNDVHADKEANGNELSYLCQIVETCLSAQTDRSSEAELSFSIQLAKTLFHDKIEELLHMKSDWPTEPPTPLHLTLLNVVHAELSLTHTHAISNYMSCMNRNTILELPEELKRFMQSAMACVHRLLTCRCNPHVSSPMSFSKSDEIAVAFVASVANLRATNFHILPQSLESIRTIAGAIVPAIATTNAMVAAGVVRELLTVLSQNSSSSSSTVTTCSSKAVTRTESNSMKMEAKLVSASPQTLEAQSTNACNALCKNIGSSRNTDWIDQVNAKPDMLYVRKVAQTRRRSACLYNPFFTHSSASAINYKRAFLTNNVKDASFIRKQTFHVLCKYYHDHYLLHTAPLPLPNALCQVCQRLLPRIEVTLLQPLFSEEETEHEQKEFYQEEELMPLERWTVGMFVEHVLHRALEMDGVSITCNERIIFEEEEYEALSGHTLMSFTSKNNNNTTNDTDISIAPESKRVKVDEHSNNDAHEKHKEEDSKSVTINDIHTPCLTFLIDALNKHVEWEVVVKQGTPSNTNARESFYIANIEEAKEIEAAALKRSQEQQQQQQQELAQKEEVTTHESNEPNKQNSITSDVELSGCTNVVEIVTDSDDDDDGSIVLTRKSSNEDVDEDEDEVMIIDD